MITGASLHFYARPDFWYDTIFTLETGTTPKQLHATIRDSSPPANSNGPKVLAIFKIEDGVLTLAVADGSDAPPASFAEASSHYKVKKIKADPAESRETAVGPSKTR